jgi:hypothetical protein
LFTTSAKPLTLEPIPSEERGVMLAESEQFVLRDIGKIDEHLRAIAGWHDFLKPNL